MLLLQVTLSTFNDFNDFLFKEIKVAILKFEKRLNALEARFVIKIRCNSLREKKRNMYMGVRIGG